MRVPFRLVARNLFKHPVRTLLTVGSLIVALFLLCVLRSLVVTLEAGVEAARSDRIIVQSAVSLFVQLPESYEAKIQAVGGVTNVCRWNWFGGYFREPANFFAQFACEPEELFPLYPEIDVVDGSAENFVATRQSCLVGADLVRDFGWKVGDTVPIISALYPRSDGGAWEFRVAGIYESSSSAVDERTLFFHWKYLSESLEQGAARGPDGVGIYVVGIEKGHEPIAVMAAIDALFENGPQRVQSTSESEFQAQFVSMIGNIPFFVGAIGTGVLIAIVLAVINTMLMAAREQSRDAGILQSMGFGGRAVFLVFLLQSLILAVAGGALGVLLALASSPVLAKTLGTAFPGYHIDATTACLGLFLSVAIGGVAGVVPAWRLSRRSPVESLRARA